MVKAILDSAEILVRTQNSSGDRIQPVFRQTIRDPTMAIQTKCQAFRANPKANKPQVVSLCTPFAAGLGELRGKFLDAACRRRFQKGIKIG